MWVDISPTIIKENGHYNWVTTIKWVFPQLQRKRIEKIIFFYFFVMESPQ